MLLGYMVGGSLGDLVEWTSGLNDTATEPEDPPPEPDDELDLSGTMWHVEYGLRRVITLLSLLGNIALAVKALGGLSGVGVGYAVGKAAFSR